MTGDLVSVENAATALFNGDCCQSYTDALVIARFLGNAGMLASGGSGEAPERKWTVDDEDRLMEVIRRTGPALSERFIEKLTRAILGEGEAPAGLTVTFSSKAELEALEAAACAGQNLGHWDALAPALDRLRAPSSTDEAKKAEDRFAMEADWRRRGSRGMPSTGR